MNLKYKISFFCVYFFPLFVSQIGCDDGHLRGYVKPSDDGKTYLVIIDNNGGGCGPILVDGKEWKHKINEVGIISPGLHNIECGGTIQFEIPEGVIFYFDYWGP